jgi:hypothetical protein
MRRLTAGLACAAAAALITPTAAAAYADADRPETKQAAPQATAKNAKKSKNTTPDPVAAVGKRLAAGAGVTYRSATTVQGTVVATTSATFRLDRSGLAASDVTSRLTVKPAALGEDAGLAVKPERTIKIGDVTYLNSPLLRKNLPTDRPLVEENGPEAALLTDPLTSGRAWIETRNGPVAGALGVFGQLVNPAEPGTLKALLATTKSTRSGVVLDGAKTTVYRGTVTIGRLHKVSPWLRATLPLKSAPKAANTAIDWALYVGKDGLPRRIVTSWSPAALGLGSQKFTVDSRFTSWAANVRVKPPADDQIVRVDPRHLTTASPLGR